MEFVGKSTNGIQLLDMQHIPEMTTVERIAYVYDVSLGVSKLEDGFVKFFLKDCNAAVTTAVMFNVEKFFESGMKASAFKGKPIRFKCMAQEFNGRLSLVIDGNYGVSIYDGPFEYERFIGKLDSDVVSVQDTAAEIATWNIKCVCSVSGAVGNFKWLYISCIVTYWCGVCTFHFLGDCITGCSSGCGERASVKGS